VPLARDLARRVDFLPCAWGISTERARGDWREFHQRRVGSNPTRPANFLS
jgi:hypothetical protein